jgi:hypothetical protein
MVGTLWAALARIEPILIRVCRNLLDISAGPLLNDAKYIPIERGTRWISRLKKWKATREEALDSSAESGRYRIVGIELDRREGESKVFKDFGDCFDLGFSTIAEISHGNRLAGRHWQETIDSLAKHDCCSAGRSRVHQNL